MPGGSGTFFPPVDYSFGWALLAAALVLLVIGFYVLVPLLLRTRRPASAPTSVDWIPEPATVRQKYDVLIDDVVIAHHRGELGLRAAHQRLSLLLRFFAYESSGIRAPQMTLDDLRRTRVTPLGDAVERLYPGAFREVEQGSVDDAAAMAKQVIATWN